MYRPSAHACRPASAVYGSSSCLVACRLHFLSHCSHMLSCHSYIVAGCLHIVAVCLLLACSDPPLAHSGPTLAYLGPLFASISAHICLAAACIHCPAARVCLPLAHIGPLFLCTGLKPASSGSPLGLEGRGLARETETVLARPDSGRQSSCTMRIWD